jgi:hypothetical protein
MARTRASSLLGLEAKDAGWVSIPMSGMETILFLQKVPLPLKDLQDLKKQDPFSSKHIGCSGRLDSTSSVTIMMESITLWLFLNLSKSKLSILPTHLAIHLSIRLSSHWLPQLVPETAWPLLKDQPDEATKAEIHAQRTDEHDFVLYENEQAERIASILKDSSGIEMSSDVIVAEANLARLARSIVESQKLLKPFDKVEKT